MFTMVIAAAGIGILAGFLACLMCKETYDSELVEWDALN